MSGLSPPSSSSSSLSVKADLEELVETLNTLFASPVFTGLMARSSAAAAQEQRQGAQSKSAAELENEALQLQRMNRLADYLEGLGDDAMERTVLAELQQMLSEVSVSEGAMQTTEEKERIGGETRACGLLAHLL